MRPPEERGLRALIGWSAALLGALLLTVAIPMTTSAFTATITNSADSAVSKRVFTCADLFAGDSSRKSAFFEYALREDAGATTAVDSGLRGNSGTYQGANAKDTGSPRPCPADSGAPYALNGSDSRVLTSTLLPPIRQDFSIEVWFKTPRGTVSEKLIGFEATQGDASDNYDKHLYIDSGGYLNYGIYDGNTNTVVSKETLNDGAWHQAVATTSAAGSSLYVDGVLERTDTSKVLAEGFSGYWRVGQGKLQQWPGAPAYSYFTGSLSFAAAYGEVLSAAEIRASYDIGKPGPVVVASATPDATETAAPAPSASAASAVPSASVSTAPSASASTQPGGAKASSAPVASDISTTPGGAPPGD